MTPQKARLLRSRSFCHQEIEDLLANDHRELIGDFSKVGGVGRGGAAPRAEGGAVSRAPCWCENQTQLVALAWGQGHVGL